MIRKIINPDNTFGANYDEGLKSEYIKAGVWPESGYIELEPEKAYKIDSEPDRYMYSPDVPGIFLGYPMGVIENPAWTIMQYDRARSSKYSEITNLYDYANQYYVANLYEDLYGNVAWLNTWNKVVNLCDDAGKDIVPNAVRYYKKPVGSKKFVNVYVNDVKVSDLKYQIKLLEGVQFNILQPKRDSYYKILEQSRTIQEIQAIEVNYGFTINEQDTDDVAAKVDVL